ncbi:MAG TPA: hypothetical protein VKA12_13405 [Roseiarcus sp.]|nr:hypothetical protein [Roseiarcus sp.]
MRGSDRRFAGSLWAAFLIGAAWSISSSRATPGEINMADNAAKPAAAGSFASKSEAEAFLARVLPAATAANPKYRSPGSDIETRWLTKKISFRDREGGGVVVLTAESVEDYRAGALSAQRTHRATFAVDDVAISEETADDLAENGEKARGVLFTCVGAPCIEAVWGGERSTSASTDVYLQDETQRRQMVDAFRALQEKSASP